MYILETLQEPVSVHSFSNATTKRSGPVTLIWNGKTYRITNIGLHHTVREGRVLYHIFSVTDGSTYFKLKYDTETLRWKLLEVATE